MTTLNVKFTYRRFGQILQVVGWVGVILFLGIYFVPTILAYGVLGLSDRQLATIGGLGIGLLFGYLIGAGKAIFINFDDNDQPIK